MTCGGRRERGREATGKRIGCLRLREEEGELGDFLDIERETKEEKM